MCTSVLFQRYITYFLFISSCLSVHGGIVSPPVGCTTFQVRSGVCDGHGECRLGNSTHYTVTTEGNLPGSQCVCDAGWSGINDFINMDTHDCGTSLIAVRVIWTVILLSTLLELGMLIYKLSLAYTTLQNFLANREIVPSRTNMSKTGNSKGDSKGGAWVGGGSGGGSQVERVDRGNSQVTGDGGSGNSHVELGLPSVEEINNNKKFVGSARVEGPQRPSDRPGNSVHELENHITPLTRFDIFQVWWQWPIVKVCLISLTGCITIGIACLFRIINPELAIGVFPYSTFAIIVHENAFIFSTRVVTTSWLDVRSKVLRFTEQNQEAAARAIYRFRQSLYVTFILDIFRALSVFLLHPFQGQSNLLYLIYCMLLVATMLIGGVTTMKSGHTIVAILEDGLDMLKGTAKVEREKVLLSLRTNLKANTQSIIGTTILAFLSGFWPFLRARLCYFMIQGMIIGLLTTTHLLALHPPKINTLKGSMAEKTPSKHSKGPVASPSNKEKEIVSRKQSSRHDLEKERETEEEMEKILGVFGFEEKKVEEEKKMEEIEEIEKEKIGVTVELMSTGSTTASIDNSTQNFTPPAIGISSSQTDSALSSSVSSHPFTVSCSDSGLDNSSGSNRPIFNPFH